MKTKIFEALKTKYANLGFSKEVLEGVATQLSTFVTEEEKIATAVEGAETMLKSFQSFADSRVNAFKSESDKYKSEAERLEAELTKLKKPTEQEPTEEVPGYVKSIQESISKMQESISGFQSASISKSLKDKFITIMGDKKVPESYYQANLIGRDFKDENQLNEFVEAVSNQYEKHQQELTNMGFVNTKPPENGKETVEKESKELADQIRQGTKEIVEQNNKN